MNIAYDSKVDALYIKLIPGRHRAETRNIDDDIALNFDERDRLVEVEVLDASNRLDLRSLLPVKVTGSLGASAKANYSRMAEARNGWRIFTSVLREHRESGAPIETRDKRSKNWVVEIDADYGMSRRDRTGNAALHTSDPSRYRRLAMTTAKRGVADIGLCYRTAWCLK